MMKRRFSCIAWSVCLGLLFLAAPAPVYADQYDLPEIFAPRAIAAAPDGSFLAADDYNNIIWRISENGISVYAGFSGPMDLYGLPGGGYSDGPLLEMRMEEPWDIISFGDGFMVTDRASHAVRYLGQGGAKTAAGGKKEGYEDNLASHALFSGPTGLAADPEGNLYIADTGNDVIRRLSPSGKVDTVLRGLSGPTGLCYMGDALYVADTGNNRIVKAVDGKILWTAGQEEGYRDGPAAQCMFSSPSRIAASPDGALYISDTGNGVVRKIVSGQVSSLPVSDTAYPGVTLVSPEGLLAREEGVYVCDSFMRRLFVLSGSAASQ